MSTTTTPPIITCHVLDTVKGTPAANIPVTLSPLNNLGRPQQKYHGRTNHDGRVTAWSAAVDADANANASAADSHAALAATLMAARAAGDESLTWTLTFAAGEYFGPDAFWDDIEVRFRTGLTGADEKRGHWHVPLLLSPWSYTTYRGS